MANTNSVDKRSTTNDTAARLRAGHATRADWSHQAPHTSIIGAASELSRRVEGSRASNKPRSFDAKTYGRNY
jgi:hypothetical protein